MPFQPTSLGTRTLSNRVVMAPLPRVRADHRDRVPDELMVQYDRQRAAGNLQREVVLRSRRCGLY